MPYTSTNLENLRKFKRRGKIERVRIDFNAQIRVSKANEMEIRITTKNFSFPNNTLLAHYFDPVLRANTKDSGLRAAMILELVPRTTPNPSTSESPSMTVLKVHGDFTEFVHDEPYNVFLRWFSPGKWAFSLAMKPKNVSKNLSSAEQQPLQAPAAANKGGGDGWLLPIADTSRFVFLDEADGKWRELKVSFEEIPNAAIANVIRDEHTNVIKMSEIIDIGTRMLVKATMKNIVGKK